MFGPKQFVIFCQGFLKKKTSEHHNSLKKVKNPKKVGKVLCSWQLDLQGNWALEGQGGHDTPIMGGSWQAVVISGVPEKLQQYEGQPSQNVGKKDTTCRYLYEFVPKCSSIAKTASFRSNVGVQGNFCVNIHVWVPPAQPFSNSALLFRPMAYLITQWTLFDNPESIKWQC